MNDSSPMTVLPPLVIDYQPRPMGVAPRCRYCQRLIGTRPGGNDGCGPCLQRVNADRGRVGDCRRYRWSSLTDYATGKAPDGPRPRMDGLA